jgi:uncharacterized pyridoxamine 5'-phosphate oxidase family protein
MQEIYEFLKKSGTYYLATIDGNKPRVRPFGTVLVFENRLYFQTGKAKSVSAQIAANPNVEICAMADDRWIRIEAVAVEDDRRESRQAMLDAYPELKDRYHADDGNTQVFYLKNATATISSFTGPPKVITF